MAVAVVPDHFTMVDYDHGELSALASELASKAGLPEGLDVEVEIIEDTPAARVTVHSLEPLRLSVEGGAIEHPKRPRQLGTNRVVDVLGHAFLQAKDRLDPAFGAPATGEEVPLAHRTAWDAYTLGRVERLGYDAQRPRRLYHFRNRHGFTDAADAAFDTLWAADGLTYAGICAISDEARAAQPQS